MKAKFLLIASLIFLNSIIHAEGGCPAGMIPYSGTNINSCGPVPPGYYQKNQMQRPSRWITKWGAFAIDDTEHMAGASNDKESEQTAVDAAIEDCKVYGGHGCRSAGSYSNQCISVVSGDTHTDTATSSTLEQAVSQGMQRCLERNQKDCHVFYSACSLPERIQ